MFTYNYTLYNASDNTLFNLEYAGTPQHIDNSFYYSYKVLFSNLRSEYKNRNHQHLHNDDFSLYPMAVRYADPVAGLYIIERPPFQVEVDFSTGRSYMQRKSPKYLDSLNTWIPWTVSVIKINYHNIQNNPYSFYMYFNDAPLQSLDDLVIPSYFPNTSSDGSICLGQDSLPVIQTIAQDKKNITAIYNAAFNSYFTGWNSDLYPEFLVTPYIKDLVLNRIINIKGSPRSLRSLKEVNQNHFAHYFTSGSSSKYLSKIMYTVSNMSLEEIFNYIRSCKEVYIKANEHSNKADRSTIRHRAKIDNPTIINPYSRYGSIASYIASDIFLETEPFSLTYNVSIKNTDAFSDLPQHYIDNPYLISLIYKHVQNLYESEDLSSFGKVITLDASELVQYNIKDSSNENIISA